MGLITETVRTRLSGKTIKHYESLGYIIPREKDKQGRIRIPRGTCIEVNVNDLFPTSQEKVTIECDKCKKQQTVSYESYMKHNRDGKCYCNVCSAKMNSGENNPCWKPDKLQSDRENDRNIDGYQEFIQFVLLRDNYTCNCCGKRGVKLCVHHLNGYNWFTEGRTDQANAITLCKNCHENFHSIYGNGNNTKEQYEEWIGETIGKLEIYNGILPKSREVYCIEDNRVYSSTMAVAKEYNTKSVNVCNVCNHKIYKVKYINKNNEETYTYRRSLSLKGKHFLWYDEYLQMSEEEIINILNQTNSHKKPVVCLTNKRVFESIIEAERFYNCPRGSIWKCCKNKCKTAGSLSDGTKLQWMYYDDYLKTLENEQIELSDENVV